MRFFNENDNNNDEIQHLITFQEAQKEDDKKEEEKLPHFTLRKIQNDKNKTGDHEITAQPQQTTSNLSQTPSKRQ